MPSLRSLHLSLVLGALAGVVSACATDQTAAPATPAALTVYGAGSVSAGAPRATPGNLPDDALWGGAATVNLKVYALWISQSSDCSGATLVQQYPSAGVDKDFMQHPVLFQGTPPNGSYQCVIMKMSDVIRMKPSTSFGSCVLGTEYSGDIYREGESDWKDVDLNPVVGSGTEEAPVDDHVTIFMTRDPAAAISRGISQNQIVELTSNLVVPGQSTFVMDASNAVLSVSGSCGLEKPELSFR